MAETDDPILLYTRLREQAALAGAWDSTAAVLATCDVEGRPAARTVLIKGVDASGFRFYTNKESRKGIHLQANPHAALCAHWPEIGMQITVAGPVEPLDDEENDAYFRSRPRLSQVGAWASDQSRPLESREALMARVEEISARYEGVEVPRPPHWGGYLLIPRRVEHWINGDGRLHDRFAFEREAGGPWVKTRLNP